MFYDIALAIDPSADKDVLRSIFEEEEAILDGMEAEARMNTFDEMEALLEVY